MRNLKKILALVLALVMSFSLVSVASADYTDKDQIDPRYNEAVQVLSGMGIFKGYEDGSFNPKGLITREEVATMMYRVISEDVKDAMAGLYVEAAKFSDVANTKWSAGFIGYCYNGNYIKGYEDGTFGPAKNVTGYEVLAMILRAVGFDKNGEFSGANWKKNIGTVAQQLGILNKVAPTVVLSAPATRELVAELIFRTLVEAEMVEYTPAFGYQPVLINTGTETTTLGLKNFGLYSKSVVEMDDWGRPAKGWFYDCGAKVTYLPYAKVFETNVETTECDIAKTVGFGNTKAIESAWVDGNKVDATTVTSNGVASIAALATTSEIGAQGCVTEVYDIGGTLRVVQINTYLGQVTNVVPVYTDRNGHTTPAYIHVGIYADDGDDAIDVTLAVAGNDFAYGEYVLVNVPFFGTDDAYVESIVKAPRTAAGQLLGYTEEVFITPATHVLTVGTYKDADKFELNWRDTTKAWDVLTDSFGNIIGLVESATNYAVVEKLEWKHNASNFGGYALADIVLANGERVSGVTIATINGDAANNVGEVIGNPVGGVVSDNLANNTAYYNHIFVYSVNANGSYNLTSIADHVAPNNTHRVKDLEGAAYDNRNATIHNQNNTVVATDNTVFMMLNKDGYTYTVYTGRTVPSFTNAKLCIMTDDYGYAKTVVISACTLVDKAYLTAYVVDVTPDVVVSGVKGYFVYELGKTEPTLVYDTVGNFETACANTGIYTFNTNSSNYYLGINDSGSDFIADTGDATIKYFDNNDKYVRNTIRAGVSGNSFQVNGADYIVSADTVVIKVDYDANSIATLTAGSIADLQAGKSILMQTYYAAADYIYVISRAAAPAAPTPPALTGFTTTEMTFLPVGNETINEGLIKNLDDGAYQFETLPALSGGFGAGCAAEDILYLKYTAGADGVHTLNIFDAEGIRYTESSTGWTAGTDHFFYIEVLGGAAFATANSQVTLKAGTYSYCISDSTGAIVLSGTITIG